MLEIDHLVSNRTMHRSDSRRHQSTAPIAARIAAPTTVPIAFVNGMLSGLQARNEPVSRFLADAGISAELLQQPSARVPAQQYALLFRLLIELREDECLGFLPGPLKPGSFALIARSALGAPDLGTSLHRISKTFWLLQNEVVAQTLRKGALAGFSLNFSSALQHQPVFLHEMLLRVFWRLTAWLAGGRLPIHHFEFAFECPPYVDAYSRIFPGDLQFGHQATTFWFDAEILQSPVRQDEAALRVFLADAQAQVILPRSANDVVSARVREHLQTAQPAWPDLALTASALHMSTSTLQRRLALEGTSFQALKDALRRDLAIVRLNTSTASLAELAQDLGFTDSGSFQRAFKAWTGSAPGAYRKGGVKPEKCANSTQKS